MENSLGYEEIQWEVVKSMIDEFPSLRNKVETYIKERSK
jgi:hypothetical protein